MRSSFPADRQFDQKRQVIAAARLEIAHRHAMHVGVGERMVQANHPTDVVGCSEFERRAHPFAERVDGIVVAELQDPVELGPIAGAVQVAGDDHWAPQGGGGTSASASSCSVHVSWPAGVERGPRVEREQHARAVHVDVGDGQTELPDRVEFRPGTQRVVGDDGDRVVARGVRIDHPMRIGRSAAPLVEDTHEPGGALHDHDDVGAGVDQLAGRLVGRRIVDEHVGADQRDGRCTARREGRWCRDQSRHQEADVVHGQADGDGRQQPVPADGGERGDQPRGQEQHGQGVVGEGQRRADLEGTADADLQVLGAHHGCQGCARGPAERGRNAKWWPLNSSAEPSTNCATSGTPAMTTATAAPNMKPGTVTVSGDDDRVRMLLVTPRPAHRDVTMRPGPCQASRRTTSRARSSSVLS